MKDEFTKKWIIENSLEIVKEYEKEILAITIRELHYRLVFNRYDKRLAAILVAVSFLSMLLLCLILLFNSPVFWFISQSYLMVILYFSTALLGGVNV
jgi:hypothetical protein